MSKLHLWQEYKRREYKKRILIIGIAVSLGVIAGFLNSYFGLELFSPDATIEEVVVEKDESCDEEIKLIDDVNVASMLGEAFFGGDRGYNLRCASLAYARGIQLNPRGDVRMWHQLGRIDFLNGRFGSAIYKFNKQIEYFGDDMPNVHYMMGLTYGYSARDTGKESEWQKAEESFLKFIELDPVSWAARVDLSWIFFAQGKYMEMKPHLEAVLENSHHNAWVLNMYALSLLNTGEKEESHPYFVEALEMADHMTVQEWGESYPGNDPQSWSKGLEEMRIALKKNIEISSSSE